MPRIKKAGQGSSARRAVFRELDLSGENWIVCPLCLSRDVKMLDEASDPNSPEGAWICTECGKEFTVLTKTFVRFVAEPP